MPHIHRQEKLGELIAVELSELLRTRVKDPRVGFASITHVEVSGDLRHAKVYVSVLGDAEAQKQSLKALNHASGLLRGEFARRGWVNIIGGCCGTTPDWIAAFSREQV